MQAVREMPSGQAAPMIAFISLHIPALAALPGKCSQAAFGEVLASCLTAIRVEVVSAPTLACAAAALLTTSLSPALRPLLLHIGSTSSANTFQLDSHTLAAGEESGLAAAQLPWHAAAPSSNLEAQHAQQASAAAGNLLQKDVKGTEQVAGCLLRLYHGAVALYGQCAATQLQIQPLPGQGTGLSTHQPSQQPESGVSHPLSPLPGLPAKGLHLLGLYCLASIWTMVLLD